ncbi:LytTR family transcriptional regulator DNA-binding domain-containing protein [Paracrocinitomix mangrovi]|uniref:LytTR family transcriptional regulator DNA-binding domain-containing protein n=1 Tax=Paracrocinitomix mangrovi TaxID=2862509 RepID=UPI001C8D740C|nr:LytTR family transcriptional regulator DNA-binding domain-containing protein [Paracrocinitomix mangrovi]UKN00795.1 LytTR family transcriptional regulator DNA-binding domain-containing protein [Paracrocinitomix mangrovi]
MKVYISILVLTLVGSFNPVWSQSNSFINFNVNDGLPSSEVYDVKEDNCGYLWFITDNGVSRYDGYKFENFNTEDGLCDNVILKASQNDNGTIFFYGQNNTITELNCEDVSFIPYKYNHILQTFHPLIPNAFRFRNNGNLIVVFLSKYYYLEITKNGEIINSPKSIDYQKKGQTTLFDEYENFVFLSTPGEYDHLRSTTPFTIEKYTHKFDGLKLNDSTSVFNEKHGSIHLSINGKQQYFPYFNDVRRIGRYDKNLFWFSSESNGFFVADAKGKIHLNYLQKELVSGYLKDQEGNEWFTCINHGVYVKAAHQANIISQDANVNYVDNIDTNKFGDKIIVFRDGNVATLKSNHLETTYTSNNNIPSNIGYSKRYNSCIVIIGDRFIQMDNEIEIKWEPTSGQFLYETSDSALLIGGYSGVFCNQENNNWKRTSCPTKTYGIVEYKDKMYAACYSGLYCAKLSDKSNFKKCDLYEERISSLCEAEEYLIIGTHNNGILITDGEKVLFNIPRSMLKGALIRNITYDIKLKNLWIGTSLGLFVLKVDEDKHHKSSLYDISNQVPCKEITKILIHRDTAWIGTKKGLHYLPSKVDFQLSNNHFRKHLAFKKFTVNDKSRDPEDFKNLSHHENRITINYNAIIKNPLKKPFYRYKLEPAEIAWNYTENTSASYANLNYGDYLFRLQLKETHYGWGREEIILPIIIHPPFWRTWWFRVSVILGISLLIYLFFRFRILLYNRDLVREMLRHLLKRIKREEHYLMVKVAGTDVKIRTSDIMYVKSDGNYIEIHTEQGKHLVREKIGNFLSLVPDPIEFLRVRRSFIVRIDKVTQKGKKYLVIDNQKIQVGETYLEEYNKIVL